MKKKEIENPKHHSTQSETKPVGRWEGFTNGRMWSFILHLTFILEEFRC